MNFAGRAFHFGQPVERGFELGAQLVDVDPGFHEQRPHGASLAVQKRQQYVRRL